MTTTTEENDPNRPAGTTIAYWSQIHWNPREEDMFLAAVELVALKAPKDAELAGIVVRAQSISLPSHRHRGRNSLICSETLKKHIKEAVERARGVRPALGPGQRPRWSKDTWSVEEYNAFIRQVRKRHEANPELQISEVLFLAQQDVITGPGRRIKTAPKLVLCFQREIREMFPTQAMTKELAARVMPPPAPPLNPVIPMDLALQPPALPKRRLNAVQSHLLTNSMPRGWTKELVDQFLQMVTVGAYNNSTMGIERLCESAQAAVIPKALRGPTDILMLILGARIKDCANAGRTMHRDERGLSSDRNGHPEIETTVPVVPPPPQPQPTVTVQVHMPQPPAPRPAPIHWSHDQVARFMSALRIASHNFPMGDRDRLCTGVMRIVMPSELAVPLDELYAVRGAAIGKAIAEARSEGLKEVPEELDDMELGALCEASEFDASWPKPVLHLPAPVPEPEAEPAAIPLVVPDTKEEAPVVLPAVPQAPVETAMADLVAALVPAMERLAECLADKLMARLNRPIAPATAKVPDDNVAGLMAQAGASPPAAAPFLPAPERSTTPAPTESSRVKEKPRRTKALLVGLPKGQFAIITGKVRHLPFEFREIETHGNPCSLPGADVAFCNNHHVFGRWKQHIEDAIQERRHMAWFSGVSDAVAKIEGMHAQLIREAAESMAFVPANK